MSTPQPELRRERRMPVRTIGAVSASVIAFPMLASPAQAGTIPYPKPSRTLPAALDVAAFYQEGTRCLTENQPGAVAFAKLLNTTYGTRTYGILRKCAAEHGEGRALDWMIDSTKPANLALANALTRWLAAPDAQGRPGAMARRFGINYIIFNRQQWKAWAPERGWTAYYGVSPHTDHIHFSFNWDGAYKRTSWWSGVAVTKPLTGPTGSTTTRRPPPDPPLAPVITSTGYPAARAGCHGRRGRAGPEGHRRHRRRQVRADHRGRPGHLAEQARPVGDQEARQRDLGEDDRPQAHPRPEEPAGEVQQRRARRGSTGAAVTALQKAIGDVTVDGTYGADDRGAGAGSTRRPRPDRHRRDRHRRLVRPDGCDRRRRDAPAPRRPRPRPPDADPDPDADPCPDGPGRIGQLHLARQVLRPHPEAVVEGRGRHGAAEGDRRHHRRRRLRPQTESRVKDVPEGQGPDRRPE